MGLLLVTELVLCAKSDLNFGLIPLFCVPRFDCLGRQDPVGILAVFLAASRSDKMLDRGGELVVGTGREEVPWRWSLAFPDPRHPCFRVTLKASKASRHDLPWRVQGGCRRPNPRRPNPPNPRQAPLAGKVGCLGELTQPQAGELSREKIRRKDKAVSFCIRLGKSGKFQMAGQRSEEMAISSTPENAHCAGHAVAA